MVIETGKRAVNNNLDAMDTVHVTRHKTIDSVANLLSQVEIWTIDPSIGPRRDHRLQKPLRTILRTSAASIVNTRNLRLELLNVVPILAEAMSCPQVQLM